MHSLYSNICFNMLSNGYLEWLISVISKFTVLRLKYLCCYRWVWFEEGARQWHFMAVTGDCILINMQCRYAIIQWYIALINIHFIHMDFGVYSYKLSRFNMNARWCRKALANIGLVNIIVQCVLSLSTVW